MQGRAKVITALFSEIVGRTGTIQETITDTKVCE